MDDEPDLTSLFKQVLESAGFSVTVFNNSADALKVFRPRYYDLVMLDIVMPKVDGFDLYKELRKVDPDVKVQKQTLDIFNRSHSYDRDYSYNHNYDIC